MSKKQLFNYVPLTIGLGVLLVGIALAPWSEVLPYFTKFRLIDYLIILALGVGFYLTRILRYGYILRTLNESHVSQRRVGLSYMVGQPISLVPGGEFYRSVLLKKYANVSMKNGLPTVFIQSLTEGFGLVLIALIGAIIIGKYIGIVALVALLYVVVMILIQLHNSGRRSHSLLNKLPYVNVSLRKLQSFLGKNKQALRGSSLVILLLSSLISTVILVITLLYSASVFGINELTVTEALIAVSLPLILQYASLLPGGIGVNEQGSVGILVLMNVPLPAAVALTIVIRFISLWLGLMLGLAAIAYTKLSSSEKS